MNCWIGHDDEGKNNDDEGKNNDDEGNNNDDEQVQEPVKSTGELGRIGRVGTGAPALGGREHLGDDGGEDNIPGSTPSFSTETKKRPTSHYNSDDSHNDNQLKPEPESSLREKDDSYIDTGPCGAPALLCDKPDGDGDSYDGIDNDYDYTGCPKKRN